MKSSFTVVNDNNIPTILTVITDEATGKNYELEVILSWNGVTLRLPNQADESEEKSVTIDVWDGKLSAYIFDNAAGEEPEKIIVIPKLSHSQEIDRTTAHKIIEDTPFGKIKSNDKTVTAERMNRTQLLSLVKSLCDTIDELKASDILLKEFKEESGGT